MATWRCFEKTKAGNPKGNVWELEYCELENFRFFSFPIPTISYQRLSGIPRALLIVEAARIFSACYYLALHKVLQNLLPPHSRAITMTKTQVGSVFSSCGSFPLRCHPKFQEGKSLAILPLYFLVPKALFQCHFHEEMNLPGKLLDRKENLHSESS